MFQVTSCEGLLTYLEPGMRREEKFSACVILLKNLKRRLLAKQLGFLCFALCEFPH